MVSNRESKVAILSLMVDVGTLLQMKCSSCRTLELQLRELA